MRRDIADPMCQRECMDCPIEGITPADCPGDCGDCRYSRFCPCGNRFIYPQFAQLACNSAKGPDVKEILIEEISLESLRPPVDEYDKAMVRILSRMLKVFGQPRPVIVILKKSRRQEYHLIGRMDILLAAKALGWKKVRAEVTQLDDYEAAVQFYRCELERLDLSWENQARCLLALQDLYRERNHLLPSLSSLSQLSGLSTSRARDLLHGITLLKKHGLSDGTIPFPTLLRSVRLTYPDSIQRELIRGLAEEGWTRRHATGHATAKIRRRPLHIVVEYNGQDGKERLARSSEQPAKAGGIGNPERNRAQMVPVVVGGR